MLRLSEYVCLMQLFLNVLFIGQNEIECNVVVDLVKAYYSKGIQCLVLVGENKLNDEFWSEINNSTIPPLTLFESNVSSVHVKRKQERRLELHPARDCPHYLLMFDNVDSVLHFLNRNAFQYGFQFSS